MKIGLTGGTGFLGETLIERVTAAGHHVVAWRRGPETSAQRSDPRVQWIDGRLGDQNAANELAERSDVIVHAGLDRSSDSFMEWPTDPINYFRVNVEGSLQLIEAAVAHQTRRFVFVSSGAVHEKIAADHVLDETHPMWAGSLYGAYKASVETLIHAYGFSGRLSCCSIRPTAIYGIADPLEHSKWFSIVQDVVQNRDVTAEKGSKSVHVDDVATAILLLIQTPTKIDGESYNCSDRMISDHEVATIAKRLTGSHSVIGGQAKVAKNEIVTAKIQEMGMEFGGTAKLESTLQTLIDRISN